MSNYIETNEVNESVKHASIKGVESISLILKSSAINNAKLPKIKLSAAMLETSFKVESHFLGFTHQVSVRFSAGPGKSLLDLSSLSRTFANFKKRCMEAEVVFDDDYLKKCIRNNQLPKKQFIDSYVIKVKYPMINIISANKTNMNVTEIKIRTLSPFSRINITIPTQDRDDFDKVLTMPINDNEELRVCFFEDFIQQYLIR